MICQSLAISILVVLVSAVLLPHLDRTYSSSLTVSDAYDSWTNDGILEYYWGDHIHLGYYAEGRVVNEDFRRAKYDMTTQLFEWAVPASRRSARRMLDAGCGIGGSTRHLVQDYNIDSAVGISLSNGQIERARELTTDQRIEFVQMDALNLSFPNASFDIVWSLEMEPHIPDKRRMLDSLLRVLKPGGTLILGCWNVRDTTADNPLTPFERAQVHHLLTEWAHPNFWSIADYRHTLGSIQNISFNHDDMTDVTFPSWMESILTILRRPRGLLLALMNPIDWKKRGRDLYGLWDMRDAFGKGLMRYGVFSISKN